MSYPSSDKSPDVPSDPQFQQGEKIDAGDWDDVAETAHWHYLRRGDFDLAFWDPSGEDITSTTLTPLGEDTNGLEQAGAFIKPPRPEDRHPRFEPGDRMMIVLVRVQPTGGVAEGAVRLETFNADGGQRDVQVGSMVEPPVADSRPGSNVGDQLWYAQHFVLRGAEGVPAWGVPVGRIDTDGQTATFTGVGIGQIHAVNHTTFADSLLTWIPPHLDEPLVEDGAEVGRPDPEEAALSWVGSGVDAGASQPNRVAGVLNSEGAGWDEVSALSFDGSEHYFADNSNSWGPTDFVLSVALRLDGTSSGTTIYQIVDGSGTRLVELRHDGSNVYADVVDTGESTTHTVSAAHAGTGVWEDWTVWLLGSEGDLVLFRDGIEVDRNTNAVNPNLSTSSSTHALGGPEGGSGDYVGDLAVPFFADRSYSSTEADNARNQIDIHRILAWRHSLTGLIDDSLVADVKAGRERYKGLTTAQQDRMPFAVRRDTFCSGGYPPTSDEIGEPADGTNIQYVSDAANGNAFFSTGGDAVTYQDDFPGLRLEEGNTEELFWVEQGNLPDTSTDYHSVLHDETMTVAIRLVLNTSLASGEDEAMIATGRRGDSNVFWVGYREDGSGNTEIRALLVDGGTMVYDVSKVVTPRSLLNGGDSVWVEHDVSSDNVRVSFNGTVEINTATTNPFPSSATPDGELTVGAAASSGTQTDHLDGDLAGWSCDTKTGVGDLLTTWIDDISPTG
ncbi:MAG: hypothetical protein ABEN55_07170, partial [Bradymonadaceae bacterium]